MKIFAIRDRMLDYYQRPIFAERKADVVSAIAMAINQGEKNDFCQTPEHFEVWELGELDIETGKIESKQTIITNCASLIRSSIRGGQQPGTPEAPKPAQGGTAEAGDAPGQPNSGNSPKAV